MFSILLLSVSSSCQLNAVLHEISGLPEAVTVVGVKNHHQRLVEKKDKSQDHLVNEFAEGTHYYWRFPAELLFKIFHHCLPDTGPNTQGFTPLLRLTTSRLLITICRRWREAATSIPVKCYQDQSFEYTTAPPSSLYESNFVSIGFFCDADKPELLKDVTYTWCAVVLFYGMNKSASTMLLQTGDASQGSPSVITSRVTCPVYSFIDN
ncbi:uncharacterized protein F5891DRAFT_654876 [Suillus fuscotomentosus]|uniref:F-box domain-containing protein n=1 Tax=Suillus fuscotomentosus TaxID=1912939 RepID=A0AAD4DZR5_9AGAM|nr:uncharacterized protein F5891DRAFT_654876 [Suillus fuscotomentosus]KAG1895623.1 hypothetical protein F5891DRAFT_654876 [Suillus fuscotomentosus]